MFHSSFLFIADRVDPPWNTDVAVTFALSENEQSRTDVSLPKVRRGLRHFGPHVQSKPKVPLGPSPFRQLPNSWCKSEGPEGTFGFDCTYHAYQPPHLTTLSQGHTVTTSLPRHFTTTSQLIETKWLYLISSANIK